MRLQGWDLQLWAKGSFMRMAQEGVAASDHLTKLAGNMWSLYHFVPLMMAIVGAIPFEQLEMDNAEYKTENEESAEDDTDQSE